MENYCTYCSVIVGSDADLRDHCNSEAHQLTIMSDEGRDWKFRAPARGVGSDQYTLCISYSTTGKCRFGEQCCDAHGEDELNEWKERFDYRQMKLQKAKDCQLQGCHYIEQLLEKWLTSSNPNQVMCESLDSVDVRVEPELNITISEKLSVREWTFHVSAKGTLRHIALLYETHRSHFEISELVSRRNSEIKKFNLGTLCQEWSNADNCDYDDDQYTCKVQFATAVYGTFRQAIVFDFGLEPVLVQKVCVDVVSDSDLEKLQEARDTAVSFTERWSHNDVSVVPFENKPYALGEKEECLLTCYPAPNGSKFTLTQNVIEPTLTKENFSARQHELLCIEEMAQYELLSRYNVKAQLNVSSCYLLTPNSAVTAKYAHNGELFANMTLSSVLSEDSASGRLVLTNCNTVLLAPISTKGHENRKVYEAVIEDKGKTVIYIRLSKRCCEELNLKPEREMMAEVQFQLNRLPLCEMHFAVDRLHPPSLIFPDVTVEPQLWNLNKWAESAECKLNPKQKEAVQAITTPLSVRLPPVLIIGPFGTGKTFTLAQAVRMILDDPKSRILVCTHSNSAADIYIREYLHPQVTEGRTEATPLRIYYRHRWVATVHPSVQQYCLVSNAGCDRTFNMPTVEDVKKHKVIVTTLSTSRYLVQLGLEKGFFTHILIDEAAQAMECEVIMPLSLANENTRIVLAGDHMQLSPEVYSQFAQQRNLHTSLLERLYDLYPEDFSCKVLLCENYRSHEAIISYTSELFYDNHLKASGKQPRHNVYYPLTFFTASGEDVQDCNSTAFHNNAEVFEIVERVIELKKSWPEAWGEMDDTSIGVVSPYYDQVVRIRAELRKKKLYGISVERVLNVQGKQFRVIFLSAVRTRQTCGLKSKPESELDHGFLSNARLLNTAITRAQSLVAVVGDPVSLCSVGKCRKLWEKFILTCHKENSLFGITWDSLRSQLDSMELKKSFILNPLAPEFVPGRMYHGLPPPVAQGSEFNTTLQQQQQQQQWIFLPFTNPFQGPMSALYSVPPMIGLCPMPNPQNFQNFPFNPPTPQSIALLPSVPPAPVFPQQQRPGAIPPQRMPAAPIPRKISNNRLQEQPIPAPPVKDFDRAVPLNRQQVKRNEGHHLNTMQKQQPFGRVFEDRQNEAEDVKRSSNPNELQHHSAFGLSKESVENIINSQIHQHNEEKRGKHFPFPKPDEVPNNFMKQNMQGPEVNGFGGLEHLAYQMNKPAMNGTWSPLSAKPFNEREAQAGISHNVIDNDNFQRVPFNEANNVMNEKEKLNGNPFNFLGVPPMMYPPQNFSPFPEKWHNHADSPQFSHRMDSPSSNLALLYEGYQEKLSILEKVLPSGTNIWTFLESEELTKGFLHHLLSSEGAHAARRFIVLLMAIKKDQEMLTKNRQINGHVSKRMPNQRYSSPSRIMPDAPTMRNQFQSPRPPVLNNHHQSDLFNNSDNLGLDSPVSPFSLPRLLAVEELKSGPFGNNDMAHQDHSKPAMNHSTHWLNDNGLNMAQNRASSHDQLAHEMSKLLMSNNMVGREPPPPDTNGFGSHAPINVRRYLEFEKARENHDRMWPDQNPLYAAPELGCSQGSYLSRLRNISVGPWENNYSLLFDNARPEERSPKNDFEVSNHMTAGPLSMSYPDIPDILSSHILPNGKEPASKVIRKPTRSSEGQSSSASQYMFDMSLQANNGSSLRYPQLSSEGMTYAKILRSPQQ